MEFGFTDSKLVWNRVVGLEQIGHAQGTLGGPEQNGRRAIGETSHFACHVSLIGIARNCGQVCKRLLGARSTCEIQKTLKTQHRLKCLRTIANGSRESPLKLPMAHSDPLAELFNPAMRMASKPSDAHPNHLVRLHSQRCGANERFTKH